MVKLRAIREACELAEGQLAAASGDLKSEKFSDSVAAAADASKCDKLSDSTSAPCPVEVPGRARLATLADAKADPRPWPEKKPPRRR